MQTTLSDRHRGLLIRAVRNHKYAQQLLIQARRLRRTFLCARIWSLAQNNESVALEVLKTIVNIHKRQWKAGSAWVRNTPCDGQPVID